jgi:hypothetical protein
MVDSSIERDARRDHSLVIEPLFDGSGIGRGTTLDICNTARIQDQSKEGDVL